MLKGVLAKDDSEVIMRFDDRNAEITFGDTVLLCRLIEGRYPNYNSVIPQDNPNQLTIDRKVLIGALRRVLPFASESSQLVRLHLEAGLTWVYGVCSVLECSVASKTLKSIVKNI